MAVYDSFRFVDGAAAAVGEQDVNIAKNMQCSLIRAEIQRAEQQEGHHVHELVEMSSSDTLYVRIVQLHLAVVGHDFLGVGEDLLSYIKTRTFSFYVKISTSAIFSMIWGTPCAGRKSNIFIFFPKVYLGS